MAQRNPDFARLEGLGIHFPPEMLDYIPPGVSGNLMLAMDAQPALVTVSNSGIPAFLTMYTDPKLIEILTAPRRWPRSTRR